MNITATREQRRALARENARRPLYLEGIRREDWPDGLADHPKAPWAVWRSRHYLVQLYKDAPGCIGRLSVLRTEVTGDRWSDGITWDDMQRLKDRIASDPAFALSLLTSAGIANADGTLAEAYGGTAPGATGG